MSKEIAANRERETWLKKYGWNWEEMKVVRARRKVFKYGASELLVPTIRVYYE